MGQLLERFTPREDAAILGMASNGWTPDQIALRLGRTRSAIYARAKKLKIDWNSEFQKSWRRGLSADHPIKASLSITRRDARPIFSTGFKNPKRLPRETV